MKNKLFLIFICLILLSVSSVSADDINQTNIDEVDNSVLSTSNNVIVDTTSASEDTNVLETQDNEVYVNSSVKVNGDGSKDNPFQDLKSALNTLENGGTIYIAPGNYAGENNTGLSLGSSNKNFTLTNWTAGDVILDGKQSDYSNYDYLLRVPNNLNIVGGTIIINGLTFKNFVSDCGGAISIKSSTPNDSTTISNCNFVNNYGGLNKDCRGKGGAIYASYSNYRIINSNFINNSAAPPASDLGYASAIYNDNCNYVLINSNFVDNSEDHNIIFNNNSHYIIDNSTFTSNSPIWPQISADSIIYNNNSYYTMNNSIIYNCSGVSNGIGRMLICNENCNYTVNNCNFTNSSAGYTESIRDISSNSTYNNCIFSRLTGYIAHSGIISTGGNIIINNSIFKGVSSLGVGIVADNISLFNNQISAGIYVHGQISSPTTVYVLDNKTTYEKQQDSYKLNATIYDDNNNYVRCDDFNFVLSNNTEINVPYSTTVSNGTTILFYPYLRVANTTLNPGENVISAKSKNLLNNTVKVGIINVENPEYNLDVSDVVKYYGGPERFIVNLTNYNAPLKNATVKININGVSYNRTTDDKGSCSIGLTLNSGNYEVITEYKNLSVKSNVTIKTTIFSNNVEKIFRNDTQYYATFLDTDGSLLKNTIVQFNINGIMYYRTTDDKGVARLNINLGQGNYILTAINSISGEQKGNVIKVLPSIVENHDLTKFYRNGSQYVVRLLNADGSLAGAGVNVTFNINGVFYTRTTNTSGYAKLNINLGAGDYIITAEYKGFMTSNKIRVLPVLSAEDLSMSYKDGSKFEAKLFDGQGNAYANQNIKFNINGVFYDRTTDVNGMARLNINLMAGKYIITSMYNGAAISNEITIS